jgi:hypothetical protein
LTADHFVTGWRTGSAPPIAAPATPQQGEPTFTG